MLIGGLAAAACGSVWEISLRTPLDPVHDRGKSGSRSHLGLHSRFFKAKWNTNETLSTLMMNYIATQLVAFYTIVWEVPKGIR